MDEANAQKHALLAEKAKLKEEIEKKKHLLELAKEEKLRAKEAKEMADKMAAA